MIVFLMFIILNELYNCSLNFFNKFSDFIYLENNLFYEKSFFLFRINRI